MSKKVTSVSIDEDLAERLSADDHINASGLFNRFLREYYSKGRADAIDLRLRQVDHELEAARDEVERLESEKKELESMVEEREENLRPDLEEAVRIIENIPARVDASNPAVVNHADKVGLTPQQLLEEVESN